MSPRPIGLSHSADCDAALEAGDTDRLCDECRIEADRQWTIPEGFLR